MTRISNLLYVNLRSSFSFYISDFRVEIITNHEEITPKSLVQIGENLAETPMTIHNSKGIIERMISVAHTYRNQASEGKFVYGSTYTAYNTNVQLVDGKHQIDCSSFANLLLHGVTFENSRYNGHSENVHSNLFFDGEPYRYRYAHQMARYGTKKGYAFKPKSDFSNVEPGDFLFFSWNNGISGDLGDGNREHAFMKIDHVAVFLHKRDQGQWSTLQFNPAMSSTYYNASNDYMSQCVLVVRFPLANVESMYESSNILLEGNNPKNIEDGIVVSTYQLAKPLKPNRYYSFVFEGEILNDDCYFIIQANGQNIYSDSGRRERYKGVTTFNFTYLLGNEANTITLIAGGHAGAPPSRNIDLKWCSLHEGYVRNKNEYDEPIYFPIVKDFPLASSLVSNMNSGLAPYYKYMVDRHRIHLALSLPFSTLRTGSLVIGTLPERPNGTQRMPVNLVGANNEAIHGMLQVNWEGIVSIIPYESTVQWRFATANGSVFRI